MHYRHVLDSNIQNLVAQENNISTYGDCFRYDENEDTIDSYILKVKPSSFITQLWGTRNFRIIQKHIAKQVVLDIISNK